MPELTQESSLESKEIECNLLDDGDIEYDNNIMFISNHVIKRMSNNDELNDKKLNLKRKQRW